MNELDIKPGQVWVRRDGGKVRIYATDGAGPYPIHGAFETKSGWRIAFWSLHGGYLHSSLERSFDLIRLYNWREELAPIWAALHPRFKCFAMDDDGEWFLYEHKPTRERKRYALSTGECWLINHLFNMPTPDCPWYETLTMRPEASNGHQDD